MVKYKKEFKEEDKKDKRSTQHVFKVNLDLDSSKEEVKEETSNSCLMPKGDSNDSDDNKVHPPTYYKNVHLSKESILY